MKRFLTKASAVAGGALLSSAAFAQEAVASGNSSNAGLIAIGSALAIGAATLGGTMGQGRAASAALEGIARNPASREAVFTPMIIGLALIEFQAIMGFIIAYVLSAK